MSQIAFTASHHLATEAGMDILTNGGNAVEAMVAASATVSVAYPHMTGLGGDGFWLIHKPGDEPIAIDASGYSAELASTSFFTEDKSIPSRGGKAAITIAGAVSGWQQALQWSEQNLNGEITLEALFKAAIKHAKEGIEVTESLANTTKNKLSELQNITGFSEVYLRHQKPLNEGDILKQPGLVNLFEGLIEKGLMDFYQGDIAKIIAEALGAAGSPIQDSDMEGYQAQLFEPLKCDISKGCLYNLNAPTQGVASLIILALYDRIYQSNWTELERVHHLIECTKQAFMIRDANVTDISRLSQDLDAFLEDEFLDKLSQKISSDQAMPWPNVAEPGDTIWMGAIDENGVMVSYIQSLYWEFGSGVVIPELGLVWNNRGVGFSLKKGHINELKPRVKPFHTLNPAMCLFKDGSRMVYGTMGGEGQPQTQAAVFSRISDLGLTPNEAIAQPRWLLGRTWGDSVNNLKLEKMLAEQIGEGLQELGHEIEVVDDLSEMMGHAGAIILHSDGKVEAGSDPRSDGQAIVNEAKNGI